MTTPTQTDWTKIALIFAASFAGLLLAGLAGLFMPETRGYLVALAAAAVYFVPTILAAVMNHRQLAAICVLNVFAGWTVIGWVGALVWAFVTPSAPAGHQHE